MKVPGQTLLFIFALFALSFAGEISRAVYPSVFDAPVPSYDCNAMVCDINVTRAIDVTQSKFKLLDEKNWFESGMGYLDSLHAGLTQTVHVFSANADRQLASWSGGESVDTRPRGTPREGNVSEGMSDYFNWLFLDNTYLYSREKSYLFLQIGFETNKEEGPQFLNKIKFAISLPRTQKRLQLFVGDPLEEDNDQVVNDQGNVNDTTAVGVRYFVPEFVKHLKTGLSVGIRSIDNPFIQARIEYPINFYDWLIRPVQYAEYSVKREFYEETDLYFDRRVSKSEMVRFMLQRSTETQKIGTQYQTSVSYFNTLRFGTGFRTFVGMSGETEINLDRYADPHYDDVDPTPGIYRYSIGGGWKESFLRKWLFYEIEPRVDFDMLYNWRPNYVVRYWLDFYFGDI